MVDNLVLPQHSIRTDKVCPQGPEVKDAMHCSVVVNKETGKRNYSIHLAEIKMTKWQLIMDTVLRPVYALISFAFQLPVCLQLSKPLRRLRLIDLTLLLSKNKFHWDRMWFSLSTQVLCSNTNISMAEIKGLFSSPTCWRLKGIGKKSGEPFNSYMHHPFFTVENDTDTKS